MHRPITGEVQNGGKGIRHENIFVQPMKLANLSMWHMWRSTRSITAKAFYFAFVEVKLVIRSHMRYYYYWYAMPQS